MAVHIHQQVTATCDTLADLNTLVEGLNARKAEVGDVTIVAPRTGDLQVDFTINLTYAPAGD